jgi:hypothetical protein
MFAGQFLTNGQKLYGAGPRETLQTSVQSENITFIKGQKKIKGNEKENNLHKEKQELFLID